MNTTLERNRVKKESSSKSDGFDHNLTRSSSNFSSCFSFSSSSCSNDATPRVTTPSKDYISAPSPIPTNIYGHSVSSNTQRTTYTIPHDPPDYDYNEDLGEETSEPSEPSELFNRYFPLIIANTIAYILASILFGTFVG